MTPLKAPFPYFGGKSTVADIVWERLGDVDNYVEPLAGSAAMLLQRPHAAKVETLNDLDCMVSNFWRATKYAPEKVVEWCDDPINEVDLHARHRWLCGLGRCPRVRRKDMIFRHRMRNDPDCFCPKRAGWWVWGLCQWIGRGWCDRIGEGNAHRVRDQIPLISGEGCGVHFANLGTCADRRAWLLEWFGKLRDRLRRVRMCCGHWDRVCDSPTTMTRLGVTGVFLDPPYAESTGRYMGIYAEDCGVIAHQVREWCKRWGSDPLVRIALCGWNEEHAELESLGWDVVAWKSQGGYANTGGVREDDSHRRNERIWFSPACVAEPSLFSGLNKALDTAPVRRKALRNPAVLLLARPLLRAGPRYNDQHHAGSGCV